MTATFDEIAAAEVRLAKAERQLNAIYADAEEFGKVDYDAETEALANYDAACAALEALEAGAMPASAEVEW